MSFLDSKKNIKSAKQSLKLLSSIDPKTDKFYGTISKMFEKTTDNLTNLNLTIDSIDLITAVLTDVEKDFIKKQLYDYNYDGVSALPPHYNWPENTQQPFSNS